MSIYERYGVTPIVNGAEAPTRLGGAIMRSEVVEAMHEAAQASVPMDQLQAAASRVIARVCGSEAGYVASGASAALTLATAACMARLDPAKMDELPHPRTCPDEVVICRPHRNAYDRAFRLAGARLVEVGVSDRSVGCGVRETELWEIEAAISERTAAVAYVAGPNAQPPLSEVARLAHRHGVPVVVDAAGQLPPPANLRRFIAEGADLVAFSGGKALRGPQGTGFLAGRKDLVASAALQHLDLDVSWETWDPPEDLIPREQLRGLPRHGVGRGFKVSKEQIVGLMVALELFTEAWCRGEWEGWVALLERIEASLSTCRHARCTVQRPKDRLSFPVLEVHLNEDGLGRTAFDVLNALRRGSPPVYLSEKRAHEGVLLVHPVSLDQRGADVVAGRLRQVLG